MVSTPSSFSALCQRLPCRKMERWQVIFLLFTTSVCIGVIVWVAKVGVLDSLAPLLEFAEELRSDHFVLSAIVIFCSHVTLTTCVLPGTGLTKIAAGFVLGLWPGTVVNFLATTCAACLSFSIGRVCLRHRVLTWLSSKHPKWLSFLQLIQEKGFKYLILLRFLYCPLFVKNYCVSTLDVSLFIFASAVSLGTWPSAFISSYMGTSAETLLQALEGEGAKKDNAKWVTLIAIIVYMCISCGLTVWTWKLFQEAKRRVGGEGKELEGEATRVGKGSFSFDLKRDEGEEDEEETKEGAGLKKIDCSPLPCLK